jgi:hypothetical protein
MVECNMVLRTLAIRKVILVKLDGMAGIGSRSSHLTESIRHDVWPRVLFYGGFEIRSLSGGRFNSEGEGSPPNLLYTS